MCSLIIFTVGCKKLTFTQTKHTVKFHRWARGVTRGGVCGKPLSFLAGLAMQSISKNLFSLFQIVAHCLAYCNSCLNPILYAFFSPNFRHAFKKATSPCYRLFKNPQARRRRRHSSSKMTMPAGGMVMINEEDKPNGAAAVVSNAACQKAHQNGDAGRIWS